MTSGEAREEEIRPRQGRGFVDYVSAVYRWRHAIAAFAVLAALLAGVRALRTPRAYEATAYLLIGRQTPQVLEFREVLQLDSQTWGDEYHLTQMKLLESRELARQAVEKLRLLANPGFMGAEAARAPQADPRLLEQATDRFAAGLRARRLEHSQVVAVTFRAGTAELAAQGANAAAELFIEEAVRGRANAASEAAAWLSGQIREQERKVQDAEKALQRLTEQTGIVNLEERRLLLDQELKQLGTRLNDAKARRIEAEALYRQMVATADPQSLPAVMASHVFQELRVSLAQLEQREASLLGSRLLDQHPEVVQVRAEIARARARLQAEAARVVKAAENDYLAAQAQERQIGAALDAAKAEILDLNRRGLRYDEAKRDLDAGQAVLTSLLARSKQTDVAQDLRASPIRVVDRAPVPDKPVSPRPRRDAAFAFVVALGMGIAAALLYDIADTRIKTPADLRAHLGLPLLAVVPEERGTRRVILDAGQGGPFAESYRVLRAAFDHAWPAAGGRVVCLVSTTPREGKSLTAVNLAAALAARDGSVLLVSGDLRRPAMETMLGARMAPGLTDVLAGKVPAAGATQSLEGTTLRLLSAGSAVASPSDLLRPAALEALFTELRARFRWTVFDTTPLGPAADALASAAAADGVVLVIGAEMTHRSAAAHTLARLGAAGCRVLGAVLNRARVERYPYQYGARFGHYSGHYAAEPAEAAAELAAAK